MALAVCSAVHDVKGGAVAAGAAAPDARHHPEGVRAGVCTARVSLRSLVWSGAGGRTAAAV